MGVVRKNVHKNERIFRYLVLKMYRKQKEFVGECRQMYIVYVHMSGETILEDQKFRQ